MRCIASPSRRPVRSSRTTWARNPTSEAPDDVVAGSAAQAVEAASRSGPAQAPRLAQRRSSRVHLGRVRWSGMGSAIVAALSRSPGRTRRPGQRANLRRGRAGKPRDVSMHREFPTIGPDNAPHLRSVPPPRGMPHADTSHPVGELRSDSGTSPNYRGLCPDSAYEGRMSTRYGVLPAAITAALWFGLDQGLAEQNGIAAVYSYHGGKTSSGEHSNPRGLTAAHRSLPFDTKVRVTNRRNGRNVVVRIND